MKLSNAKEVMQAFLDGKKLINKHYGKPYDELDPIYLYLGDGGYLCEEDGAGAKGHRVDFIFRDGDPEWETIEGETNK